MYKKFILSFIININEWHLYDIDKIYISYIYAESPNHTSVIVLEYLMILHAQEESLIIPFVCFLDPK